MGAFVFLIAAGVWAAIVIAVWWAALLRRRLAERGEPEFFAVRPRRVVLLIRPCAQDEPHLFECLSSVPKRRENADLHVVFGMSEDAKNAWQTAHRAKDALAARGISCQVAVCPKRGPNRKASILAEVVARAPKGCRAVVCADSNVDLGGVDLFAFERGLWRSQNCGLVWRPPVETGNDSPGNRLSEALLHGSLHAFALLGALDQKGMVGKFFAVRLCALAQVGGFEGLVDYLGEDVELARRLRSAGWEVAFDPQVVPTVCGRKSVAEAVDRQYRWMMVVKAQRPWLLASYPAVFFPLPFIGALCACGASAGWWAAVPIGAVSAMRLLVGRAARRYSGFSSGPVSWMTDTLRSDVVLIWAWTRALWGRQVVWRGNAFRLAPGGRILERPVVSR